MGYQDYTRHLDSGQKNFEIEDFLRDEQQNEKKRIEKELKKIKDLLEDRERIHSENIDELDSKLDWYLERLEQAYKGAISRKKLERLKPKIRDLYSEIRRERRRQWKDKVELEIELCEVEQALEEIEDTSILDLL